MPYLALDVRNLHELLDRLSDLGPPLDIKALTISTPNLVNELDPAFQRYNEEQFITTKLPGSSQQVVVSSHNSLGGGRYYDVESSTSFAFDHTTQVSG